MNNSITNEHNKAKVVKKRPITKIISYVFLPGQVQVHQILPPVAQFFNKFSVQGHRICADAQADSKEVQVAVKSFFIHRALESRIAFICCFHFI